MRRLAPGEKHGISLPPHAYVPGFSPRHPSSLFDEFRASVTPDTPIETLHETRAFRAGRLFFDAGYYWECHEALEPVWRQTRDPSPERDIVLALIQLANARLKVLMRQPLAAARLCDMVETHLFRCPPDRPILGLEVAEMMKLAKETRAIAKAARRLQ